MGEGWTGGASGIVKAKSSGEDPRATGGLISNLSYPRVNKTKQHCSAGPGWGSTYWAQARGCRAAAAPRGLGLGSATLELAAELVLAPAPARLPMCASTNVLADQWLYIIMILNSLRKYWRFFVPCWNRVDVSSMVYICVHIYIYTWQTGMGLHGGPMNQDKTQTHQMALGQMCSAFTWIKRDNFVYWKTNGKINNDL